MPSSTLPDISRDKLAGFRKMAVAVIDDMLEAATDAASRHEHQVDLLKARVEEQVQTVELQRTTLQRLHDEAQQACGALNTATGGDAVDLLEAVGDAVELIATLRHRIDEAQKQMSAIAADRGLVDVDVFRGDDGVIVVEIGCNDPVRVTLADGTHLHGPVRVTPEFFEATKQETLRAISVPLPGPALAAIPVEQGLFVITMKIPQGRRFWDGVRMQAHFDDASLYRTRAEAEAAKPRRSAVVTLADARELIEAEKVVSLTPPADAPTGPEAA